MAAPVSCPSLSLAPEGHQRVLTTSAPLTLDLSQQLPQGCAGAGLERAKITFTVSKSLLQSSRNIFLYKLNRQQPEREERGRILGICRDFSAHNSLLGKNKFSALPLTLSQPEGPDISLPSKIYSLALMLCVLSSCYTKIWWIHLWIHCKMKLLLLEPLREIAGLTHPCTRDVTN